VARINADLLERLQEVIGSRSNTYVLIDRTARQMLLPRNLAAIVLAMERGINVTRFASDEELAEIRAVKSGTTVVRAPTASLVERSPERPRIAKRPTTTRKRGTAVFVVHGRNEKIRRAMFAFLRTIGLKPIEWIKALESTRKGAPFVGEVLDKAFSGATAVVVLLTPDDEARSKSEFLRSNDSQHERELTGQPRPNVLFEAGMAFGSHADKTVLVQVGAIRPFSDVGGRHVVHMNNSAEKRQELVAKLRASGCEVDLGQDWLTEGDFSL